ncbi:sensor histidine kinase [Hymenobacter sp. HSC-4F20]|uniref:sensor histidine kinase n=1 Tax=Hymenobacter sp. HSC-4F20 TaxID=2864135 RepID=UPI001C72DAD4|nr:sensor histidine kinase [Hymenobacter sp. HSC-4F20]MBX0290162.1 sensor histidine kinase [Hymenobacter sp. HSC-4F20]
MVSSTLRRTLLPLLLHGLVWGLLLMLLAMQPANRATGTSYLVLQASLLGLLALVFYVNVQVAVPRLLYRRRWLGYAAFLVVAVVGVLALHRQVERALASSPASAGPFSYPTPPPPGPGPPRPYPGGPPPAGPDGPPRRDGNHRFGLFNPPVFLITLLALGLGTSVAAVQHGQREGELRQALEQEKLSTELSWLKAQINPHFFFNTLNNIYALTLLDGNKAREALHRLSRMMRYVLYETQTGTAPLSQELLFVRDYIDLMQLRLTDNVRVEFQTPEPLHDAPIAPMILLTFVENAFKHGVSTVEPSHIQIIVQHPTPHSVAVDVRNTVFQDRPVALDDNHGIGLVNTRRRLDLLYPGRYTLTVTERTPTNEYHVHLTLTLLP